ncbi:MAG: hypothetical protein Q8N05_16680 [Bacteroidota bacterium]|nr:hypothetical protein [Bacteroidota bacterium]
MRSYRKIIVCTKCKGEGYTEESSFEGHSRGYEYHKITCTGCDGSGLMKRTITITEESYLTKKI